MFALIEVKNRDINLACFSDNRDDVVKEMKTRFARSIIVCGFTVDDIKESQRFNDLCDREITEIEVDDAALQLIEIAEAGGFGLDGDYSNVCNFAWYHDEEAQITTLDDEYDWKIVDTNSRVSEELGDFGFVLNFVKCCENIVENKTAIMQLRALWTAFCIRRNIDVDTNKYDRMIRDIWLHMIESNGNVNKNDLHAFARPIFDFDRFDSYMCELLV